MEKVEFKIEQATNNDLVNYSIIKIKDLLAILQEIKEMKNVKPSNRLSEYYDTLSLLDFKPLATNYLIKKKQSLFGFYPHLAVTSVDTFFHDTNFSLKKHLSLKFDDFEENCKIVLNNEQLNILNNILKVEVMTVPLSDESVVRFVSKLS